MTNAFRPADMGAAVGFVTGFVFGVWPIILIGALGRRKGKMARLLGVWLILAMMRGIAFVVQAPTLAFVLPEPYSTLGFLVVGAMVFLIQFLRQLAKAFPMDPRPARRVREVATISARPAIEPQAAIARVGSSGGKGERLLSLAAQAATPRDLKGLSGDDFELLVVELFRRQGHQARRVGQWGDHGVDIVVDSTDGQKWIVQCKRWTSRWIGEPLVRDLFGAMHHEGADRCILVTTSWFSHPARRWARGQPVELIDGNQLLRLVRQLPAPAGRTPVPQGVLP